MANTRLSTYYNLLIPLGILTVLILGTASCAQKPESYPTAWIDYPPDGASFPLGAPITIISHVFAREGVAEVVLSVNGEAYRRDIPAEAGTDFISMQQEWVPLETGIYTLSVLGYDRQGLAGNPATISVEVVEEAQEVLPEPASTEPAITEPPSPSSASIAFYSDPPEIEAGSCATIYWKVENAKQVVLGGIDQPFSGSYETCLCKNERYTLKVILLDGTEEKRTVDITVTGSCAAEPPPPPAEDTTPPPVPSPNSPSSGQELSCRSSQSLAWTPVSDGSGIAGYYVKLEIQVKKGEWQSAGGYGPVTGKQVTANVQCGGIYRWMVRAQDKAGNFSDWSAPATFSITLN